MVGQLFTGRTPWWRTRRSRRPRRWARIWSMKKRITGSRRPSPAASRRPLATG